MNTNHWSGRLPPFPADSVQRYRTAGTWGVRTISEEFHAVAERFPARDAVVGIDGRLTYAELDRRTDQLAVGLHRIGLRPGDPVLFQVSNRLHTIVAWYGVLKAGLVPVATLAAHRMHEISQVGVRTGAVAHLVEAQNPTFDLVAFAIEHRGQYPTVRHVLTVGAGPAVRRDH